MNLSHLNPNHSEASARLEKMVSDMMRPQFENLEKLNKLEQENAQRKRMAEEAMIELNEQTKIQNRMLQEENQHLNETIMKLKNQPSEVSQQLGPLVQFQYDVFISHANDNKTEFVDGLTTALRKLGISIWYDKNNLKWGDNWKLQITNGLQKCRFGIVVISPEFLGREWTEKELNDLLQRQNETGQKVVLPLLYKMTVADMKKQYPQLADFQAHTINPGDDPRDIVIDFASILIQALKG